MESGTFNHNKKIFNLVIKYSNNTELSRLIFEEISSRTIKEYIKDIKKCGVKTPNVLFELKSKYVNLLIENYISGYTIDQILKSNANIKDKIEILRKLLKIYKSIEKDENLCLDWNLKNFIYHNNDIYYIDFVPCIYKDKLLDSNSDILKDYIESYLDSNITLQGIYYHILKTMLDFLEKDELRYFCNKIEELYEEELNVILNFNTDHPYSKGINKIKNYINSDLDLILLKKQLKCCSLGENANENFKKKHV